MARKTISVDTVRDTVNRMLAASSDDRTESRTALAVLLETVLMDTGNYHGFNYLDSEFAQPDRLTGLRDGYDDTRRRYY